MINFNTLVSLTESRVYLTMLTHVSGLSYFSKCGGYIYLSIKNPITWSNYMIEIIYQKPHI